MLRLLFLAVTLALVFAVTRWGGREERATAAVLVAASLLSAALPFQHVVPTTFGIRLIDVGLLVLFLSIATRSRHFWPLYATAFQSIAVSLHLLHFAELTSWFRVYANAGAFLAYPIYAALIAGSILEGRRREHPGPAGAATAQH